MLLRIGHLSTFYHTAMLLMADKSLASEIDADIEWKLFGTGPAIVNAFEKKEIDLAYIGLPPAIIGIERGVDIVCIAGGHVEGTVFCARSEYRGFPEIPELGDILKQFIGKTIGVPGKGSIHDVILQDSLDHARLRQEIAVKNFAWADMVMEAMVKGRVAAAFGTPALATAISHYAGGRIVFPPSMLRPNNPSYGILVDRQFLDAERTMAEQFLSTHEKATALLRGDPSQAAEMIANHVGFIEPAFVMETLALSPKYCAQLTDEYVACTMEFVDMLREQGYIKQPVAVEDIFDRTLINKIHPENDHYRSGLRVY